MTSRMDDERRQEEALSLNPYHHEYPAWCLSCGARLAVYRAANACYWDIQRAAADIHTELSPACSPDLIRIGKAVPYGESAPLSMEEHDESPFSQGR